MTKKQFTGMRAFLKDINVNITYEQACQLELAFKKASKEEMPMLLVEKDHLYFDPKREVECTKSILLVAGKPNSNDAAQALANCVMSATGYLLSMSGNDERFEDECRRFIDYVVKTRSQLSRGTEEYKEKVAKNKNLS